MPSDTLPAIIDIEVDLNPTDRPHAGQLATIDLDLVEAIMAGLNAKTAKTYRTDYRDFARFLGVSDARTAIEALVSLGPGQANATAMAYRVHLTDRGLASGTIARRLVALRSAVKAARRIGRVTWSLDCPGPKTRAYRDTRGPGASGFKAMSLNAKRNATTPKGKRDLAILRMLHDLGLRRGELVALDIAHLDISERRIEVMGKGKTELIGMTIPEPTLNVLMDWLASRPGDPNSGPIFVPLDPGALPNTRLTGDAVQRIVGRIGKMAGLSRTPRPHGLRHEAITSALDAGRDIREVRKFSRHADLNTILIYDDNRKDVAGDIASMLAREE